MSKETKLSTVHIGKVNENVELDFNALPDNAKEYIIGYGLKQVLNDAHSSCVVKSYDGDFDKLKTDVMETVQAKVEALKAGKITLRSGGTRKPADPVEAEALKIAREQVKLKLSEVNQTFKAIGKDNTQALIDQYMDKYGDETRKQAKKNIDALAEHKDKVELDLSSVL